MRIGPGQLKGLPHDEAAKDLVEPDCNRFQFMLFDMFKPVPVLRLANNKVFQLGVFEPDGVVGLDPGQDVQGQERLNPSLEMSCSYIPCFERHGFVVNRVQEEVMDDFLHKENPSHIRLTSE